MTLSMVIWLLVAIVFIVVEAATVGLVSIWFAVGALGALVTSVFTNSFFVQIMVFIVISGVTLVATRPFVKKFASKRTPTNADRKIGRTALVITNITPEAPGRVRIDGVDWNATCATALPAGTYCVITDIQSTLLIVKPEETTITA